MFSCEDSSFRDPAAFVFYKDGIVFRQINMVYSDSYEMLMRSGLYRHLTLEKWLVPHEEVSVESPRPEKLYTVIKPDQVYFISYPYEWCFSQLQDAALLTLQIQKEALGKGMALKDASAYNVQFTGCRPVFIDTSSFEIYRENEPWAAYGQFCRHFLSPLLLMSYTDARMNQLFRIFSDGIPLDFTVSALPARAMIRPMVFMNIWLHHRAEKKYGNQAASPGGARLAKKNLEILIDSLYGFVAGLRPKVLKAGWRDYYHNLSYSKAAFSSKKAIVERFLKRIKPEFIWDMGANTGEFSRIAAGMGIKTVSFDMDAEAVEKNYLQCKSESDHKILPLVLDLTNPSPGSGWDNTERKALKARRLPDAVLALALIHHLSISNSLPFGRVAGYFASLCRHLVIEFVHKSDPMAEGMIRGREDVFDEYTAELFEREFIRYFDILEREEVEDSDRIVYLMEKKC